MITQCPGCNRKYRIRDSDIPIEGASVRCPNCSNIFTLHRKPIDIKLIPVEEGDTQEDILEEEISKPSFEETITAEKPAREESVESIDVKEEIDESTPSAFEAKERLKKALFKRETEISSEEVREDVQVKHKKAKRLARSLAKDILLYHEEEVERGKREGNLVELLRDEIKKSWGFYKKQVDPDVLKERNYFKEALNEIIAGGDETFI